MNGTSWIAKGLISVNMTPDLCLRHSTKSYYVLMERLGAAIYCKLCIYCLLHCLIFFLECCSLELPGSIMRPGSLTVPEDQHVWMSVTLDDQMSFVPCHRVATFLVWSNYCMFGERAFLMDKEMRLLQA